MCEKNKIIELSGEIPKGMIIHPDFLPPLMHE